MKRLFFLLLALVVVPMYAPPQSVSFVSQEKQDEFQKAVNGYKQTLSFLSNLYSNHLSAAMNNGNKKQAHALCSKIEVLRQQLLTALPDLKKIAKKLGVELEKRERWVDDQYAALDVWQKILQQR